MECSAGNAVGGAVMTVWCQTALGLGRSLRKLDVSHHCVVHLKQIYYCMSAVIEKIKNRGKVVLAYKVHGIQLNFNFR